MLPGRQPKLEDLLRILNRRLQILLPFVGITLASVFIIRWLPDRYRSSTLIQMIPQQVPESYVRPTVKTRIEDRLRSLNQQIVSRTRLEPVIREFNLYPKEVKAGLMEDVVEQMRRDLTVEPARGDAFRISYESTDPRVAMKVTERIASMYIDANLRDREVLADGTNQFIESQLMTAKAQLIEDEKKLEEYKKRYAGQLPSQVTANLQVLQNVQLQVQSLGESINRDKERQILLEHAIAEATSSSASNLSALAAPVIEIGSADPLGKLPSTAAMPIAVQLETESRRLEALQIRLKPEHPDVARQKRVVEELQVKAQSEAEDLAAAATPAAAAAAAASKNRAATSDNRIAVMKANELAQMRANLDALVRRIADQEQAEQRLRGVIAQYQGRVEAAPTREAEMTELLRDYETLQRTYTSLLTKKEDAQIAANLERNQIGEQFKIIDPPRVPQKPMSPDRPLLYALGAALGLACGVGLAAFLEYRDTSLKTDGDVVEAFALPVLALIPVLRSTNELRQRRRRRLVRSWLTAGTAVALISIIAWALRFAEAHR